MQVEKNKVVAFYYTLRLDSGKVFDATAVHKPLHILVGYNQVIPGLENALMGMKTGDKKNGKIEPKDGYGLINKKLLKVYPRNTIPKNINLKKGLILRRRKKNGQQVKVVVKSYNETEVVLDSNHPLAGKNLSFRTKIVHIREATQEELQAGIVN
jgi:FKBP-type peptidyl-prolyl cis-trans isomerase SlyD